MIALAPRDVLAALAVTLAVAVGGVPALTLMDAIVRGLVAHAYGLAP